MNSKLNFEQLPPATVAEYMYKASSRCLVEFHPTHREADQYGMVLHTINYATVRLKQPNVFRVTVNTGETYRVDPDNNHIYYMGFLSGSEKAIKALPGTEFIGWKRTRQYKLTHQELENLIGGKIFLFGGIDH